VWSGRWSEAGIALLIKGANNHAMDGIDGCQVKGKEIGSHSLSLYGLPGRKERADFHELLALNEQHENWNRGT
jgi:hypothetical protein